MAKANVLIVDDEKNILSSLSRALRIEDYEADVAGSAAIPIGSAVAYKSASEFVGVQGGSVYNLATRVAGASTDAITRTAITFNNGRVYTITARGNMTVTTGTNAPFLDNTTNR